MVIKTQVFPIFKTARSSLKETLCKKSVLKNFASFTGKHLCQSLLLIKLQALDQQLYQKRDSATDFNLWILRIFKNTCSIENLWWLLQNSILTLTYSIYNAFAVFTMFLCQITLLNKTLQLNMYLRYFIL